MSTDSMVELIRLALEGGRGEDQCMIAEVGVTAVETLLRKNKDYGSSVFKVPILKPNLSPGDAILVRMSDKIERFRNLSGKDESGEVGEPLEETMGDLAAYGLLWLCSRKINNE